MALPQVSEAIREQDWIDPVADSVQQSLERVVQAAGPVGEKIEKGLHGTWLGHPLHPALTDVPIGAWTTAAVLDVADAATGKPGLAEGAQAAVAVGLAGAVGAAVTGLADWRHTDGNARKIGVVHGMLNGTAALLYTASWLSRRRGSRGVGRTLGFLGFATVMAGAYLGGHLVYAIQIGVDHTAPETAPEEFTPVLPESELGEGQLRKVETEEMPVLLARQGGCIYALSDTCSHLGCSLSEGVLGDGNIKCSCHGSCYALESGKVLSGPSAFPQPTLETRVREGQIEVRALRSS